MTAFATVDALRESLAAPAGRAPSPEYAAKMLHPVPDAPVVDRVRFVLNRVRGRRVLELGASGPLHAAIVREAAYAVGIDRAPAEGVLGFDLDDVGRPDIPCPDLDPELVVAGEVLEHLSNPGFTLARLRRQFPGVPVLVTVPNAFSAAARRRMAGGVENVNLDHVAWYSWRTLKTLVERAGYEVVEFCWAGPGDPGTAEGLIFVLVGGAAG